MADIVVCGGSVIGLSVAMMLARDGHQVTVFERDADTVPDSADAAWDTWERRGVPQFRQPHNLFPGYRATLEAELPEVLEAMIEAGGTWVDMLDGMPPFISDRAPRPDDDKFRFVTGRRPMVEYAHARVAGEQPGLTVRRGTKIQAFTTTNGTGTPPHVTGVRTAEGETSADLVIDAMGRRSPASGWLTGLGAREPISSSQECGFTYYTMFFRGPQPPVPMAPPVSLIGTFLVLTLPGDNSTWSVTLWAPSGDRPLKRFKDPEVFRRVVAACPLHAHWLEGEPITDVLVMGGIIDRYRRFVVDGEPVALGVASVGDAWACTNPSAGRGLSVGLGHAKLLRHAVRDGLDDLADFALRFDDVTEQQAAPWYWAQMAADQARLDAIAAVREGRAETAPLSVLPPRYEPAMRAMLHDADVFRGVLETVACLALPEEVFSRPGMWEKVEAAARDPLSIPGPSRSELLELVS